MDGDRADAPSKPASWRLGLEPGERHGFGRTPGWWDLRDLGSDEDDVPRMRTALLRALPPLADGSAVLDLGGGTGTLVALLAAFYPRLRYTLLDANAAAVSRAEGKLRAATPGIEAAFLAEPVDPFAAEPLPGAPYRLVMSSIALHDIAPPALADDDAGRQRHAAAHRSLLRRIRRALEPGGHLVYADAMRPRFRVAEHLESLRDAGFGEVDCAYAVGRFLVCGGQRGADEDGAGPGE